MKPSFYLSLSFAFISQFCLINAQSKKQLYFTYDSIKPKLTMIKSSESDKMAKWIKLKMTPEPKAITTPLCYQYYVASPSLEYPGQVNKKAFFKKWRVLQDLTRLPDCHPFEIGNGGCLKSFVKNIKYLGSYLTESYFSVTIYCDNNTKDVNKLILGIVVANGNYLIDKIINQEKITL